SALARKYNTYILSPIVTNNDRRLNSAVLLDRHGNVVFVYDQVFPSKINHEPTMNAGLSAPVYQADFGRIGFDVNFPEVWKSLADHGAELVVWSSTYSGGASLQAHALNNHYYIVSATGARDCLVYDITGEQILYQKSKDINVTHVSLDLDRGIYSENSNIAKRNKLLKEHGDDVKLEKTLDREAWFVLRPRRPGVSARALAHQYGLEELRSYIDRSRRDIDTIRGWSFAEREAQGDQP
ncbi:MAG TPA: carbon-nitrogen hydrolase family protein, partial [Nitrospira sp.]|nr:carbon-nitrogen hydrolase family protein [Nitrospira sp.]